MWCQISLALCVYWTAMLLSPAMAGAADVVGARYPALSPDGSVVAFEYWGDLWIAPVDGGDTARRLTDHLAWDWYPRFSPDGHEIAFISNRSGNQDVWVIPAAGGSARQVTTFSGADTLAGWSPDGERLIFESQRGQWSRDLYTVDKLGAEPPQQLTEGDHYNSIQGQLAQDSSLIYARGGGRWWRKGYLGTSQCNIWQLHRDGSYKQLTTHIGKDLWPMLASDTDTVYYVSDEDGIDNIWSLELETGENKQLTHYCVDGVQWPAIASQGKHIVFEFSGGLSILTLDKGHATPLQLTVSSEGKKNTVVKQSFADDAAEYCVSPHGKYVVVVHAGDLWAVKDPESYDEDEKPDQDLAKAWRLTASDGARERQPAFAPDNRHLAYASDADGDYEIYVMDLDDMSISQVTDNDVDDLSPAFSPADSNVLFYYAGNSQLVCHELESGKTNVVTEGRLRSAFGYYGYSVSPDGAWVAYVDELFDWSAEVYIVDSGGKNEPVNITRHPGWDDSPRWSADGRRLLFRGRRDDESAVYVVDLMPEPATYDMTFLFDDDRPGAEKKTQKSGKNSEDGEDEEDDEENGNGDEASGDDAGDEDDANDEKQEAVTVEIDFADIHLRARRVTVQEDARNAVISSDGEWVVYVCDPDGAGREIWSAQAEGGDASKLFDGDWDQPTFTAKGKRVYYRDGGTVKYFKFGDGKEKGRETIHANGEFWLDQRERWRQMYREAWRTLRERFYDPALHGTDWDGHYKKYKPYVEAMGTPEEFGLMFEELLGELNASHLAIYMGESSYEGEGVTTGHLGLEFDKDYAGPGLKVEHVTYQGPADQPGVEIAESDIVLSIDGSIVDASQRWEALLDDTDGHPVRLEVLEQGNGHPRQIVLQPTTYDSYRGLLYREWEIANENIVDELSGGRIGYIHIRGMSRRELRKFEREFLSEFFDKDALIVDVRFNPGGFIHEDLFNMLDRNPFGFAGYRDAPRVMQPSHAFLKPKALLINARSGSDAEIFPAGWRALGLGPVIGIDTAGAVIGTSGFRLVDGTWVRLPIEGWFELDGRNLETSGTPPDVYVDVEPGELRMGVDAQLAKAVEVLIAELSRSDG